MPIDPSLPESVILKLSFSALPSIRKKYLIKNFMHGGNSYAADTI